MGVVVNGVHTLLCTKLKSCVMGNICVITGKRTLLVITLVSSGLKKIQFIIFTKYKYLHWFILINGNCLAFYSLSGLPLRFSPFN